jgi:LacI family sucrose operon transcriptional repressor
MSKTINEIAALAGVSATTVSMVINGNAETYRISKKTQQKILEIVEETNFVPDQYARGFRLKKTQTIGLIIPDLRNWFFSQISYEVEALARKNNYQVLIACSDDNEEKEIKLIHNLLARRIDSLIIASVMKQDQITKDILNLDIPVVFVDRRIESENVSWVSSDNYQGAYDLTNHLCSKGLKRIGFFGGLKNISTTKNRLRGYCDALEHNNLTFYPSLVYQKEYTTTSGYEMAQRIFTDEPLKIDGIFTASLTLLEGTLKYMWSDRGLPYNSIMLGTYDDHPFLDYLSVKIPSVRQNTVRLAERAFGMIKEMVDGEKVVKHEVVEPELITRE